MQIRTLSRIDLGYLCFAWIAIVPWIEAVISVVPVGHDFQGFVITLLSFPIVLGTVGAGVIATYVAFVERRERPLMLMLFVMIFMFVLFMAIDFLQIADRSLALPAYVGSSCVLGLLCIRRFILVRRTPQSSVTR